jgi:O-antigen/teichoic acid export membrane protein
LINAVRIPLGVFTYAGPLLVLPYSESILAVILVLVAARVMACLVYVVLIIRTFPGLRRRLETRRESIVPLMTFGGWLTVSNVVGPVLLYADRFVIAAEMTLTDVAYYATPFEVIIKLLIIPTAILGVVFPAFSEANARNKTRLAFLYARTIGYLLLVHVPIVAIVVVCAGTGLAYWINAEFASHSTHAAQILAVGVLINGVGLVSQALVQSAGRADWTAKLHLLELPIYIGYLYVLVSSYGIVGAASAWLIRVTLSTLVLSLMAIRVIAVKQPIGTESNGR